MAVKQMVHSKTAHADGMELFLLTFAQVAGKCLHELRTKK